MNSIKQKLLDGLKSMGSDSIDFVDQLLAYIAQFLVVDGWFHMDKEKGQIAVDKLSQYE